MRALVIPILLAAAACTPSARPASAGRAPMVPVPMATGAGLERVMGQNAGALTGLFGKPDADLTEGSARKLQFGSAICVLDAYLYPPRSGHGDATVSYIDARQRDGRAIDKASCVAALSRREGGK